MARKFLSAVVASLLLAGCGLRIDASSEEAVKKSIPAVVEHAPTEIKAAVDAAGKRYLSVYFGDGDKPSSAPEWFVVDHMDAVEFVRYVNHFLGTAPPAPKDDPTPPDSFVTAQFLASLKLNKELLERARDKAHTNGLYTVDQFEWGTPKVTMPDPNEHIGSNPIMFRISFTNHTGFDVFHPQYRVLIKFPGIDYPVYDEVLTAPSETPIAPEVPTTVELVCCTSSDNERLHNDLVNAPQGTIYEYALVGLGDYGKKNALDDTQFPQTAYDQLRRIDACIDDVEKQGAAWTPETAHESCDQRDDLLAVKKPHEVIKHHTI